MSLFELIRRAYDERFTKEQATALLNERVAEMVAALHYTEDEARSLLLSNLGYAAGYYNHTLADRVYDLYGTEHPIFGRKHPTPAEAFQAGVDLAEKMNKKKGELLGNQESKTSVPGMRKEI